MMGTTKEDREVIKKCIINWRIQNFDSIDLWRRINLGQS